MGTMSNILPLYVGGTVSADIAVPEHDRELRFYSRVLCTGEEPLWREDLANNHGNPVIGLGMRTEFYADLPLAWMPHIQVADVGASVERALALNGSEIMHGKDDDGNSLWAAIADPTGAAFGIIPVVPADAIPPLDESASARFGRIAWLDLTVADADATREFYREVIGWSAQDVEMEDAGERYADYNMLANESDPAAGICHARGMNQGLPPVWMIYLPVGDLEESLRRVEEEGGKVLKTSKTEDGRVAYAAVEDPIGVAFALVPG